MKLSVSLSPHDVTVLDEYARRAGLRSRSAAVQHAIQLLRYSRLDDDYEHAFDDWDASSDAAAWETAVLDGLGNASR